MTDILHASVGWWENMKVMMAAIQELGVMDGRVLKGCVVSAPSPDPRMGRVAC